MDIFKWICFVSEDMVMEGKDLGVIVVRVIVKMIIVKGIERKKRV